MAGHHPTSPKVSPRHPTPLNPPPPSSSNSIMSFTLTCWKRLGKMHKNKSISSSSEAGVVQLTDQFSSFHFSSQHLFWLQVDHHHHHHHHHYIHMKLLRHNHHQHIFHQRHLTMMRIITSTDQPMFCRPRLVNGLSDRSVPPPIATWPSSSS